MDSSHSDRKKMIQQGFDTVAAGYDHPSLSFFPETAKRLIDYLDLTTNEHLLDVCTGTGVVAINAAKKLINGRVTGIDLSSGMLAQAKIKASQSNLDNTDFRQMDLEQLNFDDTLFDVATSSFGLFFLDDMTLALNNISDCVKPGGRIAISSFAGEAFSPMADLFLERYQASGREVPALSWKRLATEDLIKSLYKTADIDNVHIHHVPLGYQMTSAQMWWDVVWNAGWRSLLNQMTEQEQIEFKNSHLDEISTLLGDDGIWFNTEVLIAIGEKK